MFGTNWKNILIVGGVVILCFGIYVGIRSICSVCKNSGVAECEEKKLVYATESAQAQTQILIDLSKKTVPERRKTLEKWVIKNYNSIE